MVPVGDCTVPVRDFMVPAGDCMVPVGDCTVPVRDCMVPAGDCTVPAWGLHVHVRTRSVIFQLSHAPWSALGPWNLVRIPTGERLLHWGLAREVLGP